MVDTVRAHAEILALLADNTTGDIDEQDLRDTYVTLRARGGSGHVTYADNAALLEVNAQSILASTPTLLTIDGLGAQTETRWIDRLGSAPWTTDTHNLLELGQHFGILVEFKVKKTSVSTDALLTLTHDIGSDPTGGSSIPIFTRSWILTKASGVEQAISAYWGAYGKETYLANGGKFVIECSENIAIWQKEIYITDQGTPST